MDAERLITFSRAALDRVAEKPVLIATPVVLGFAGAMLDTYVSIYAWWLPIIVGALEGAAWGAWVAWLGKVPGEQAGATSRVTPIAGFALTFGVQGWNYALGLVLMLLFCVVPVVELGRRAPVFMGEQGQTWLFSQSGQAFALLLVWLVLGWVVPAMLGALFGALLLAVLLAPVLTWWVLQRAEWCRG